MTTFCYTLFFYLFSIAVPAKESSNTPIMIKMNTCIDFSLSVCLFVVKLKIERQFIDAFYHQRRMSKRRFQYSEQSHTPIKRWSAPVPAAEFGHIVGPFCKKDRYATRIHGSFLVAYLSFAGLYCRVFVKRLLSG